MFEPRESRSPNLPLRFCCIVVLQLLSAGAIQQVSAQTADELKSEAAAAREVNDIPRAIALYTQAVQSDPKWQDGWWFLGSLQYGTGAYPQGIDALNHFLELKPDAAPALALRGLCEFENGNYEKSLADIHASITTGAANDSRNEQILRYHQAMLETRLGRFQEALKSYSFFAENKISNPELFIAIGLAGLRIPLLPKDAPPDRQQLLSQVGAAGFQFMSGDEKSAGEAFEQLFVHFSAAENLHFFYGHLLFATDPDAALPQFQKELEVAPANADAQVMTAWALFMRNRATEALPYAQKAVAEKAGFSAAELVLGRCLVETGDLTGGIQHLEAALKIQPDDLEVHIALAKAYSKSGRKEDARHERILCMQLTQDRASQIVNP